MIMMSLLIRNLRQIVSLSSTGTKIQRLGMIALLISIASIIIATASLAGPIVMEFEEENGEENGEEKEEKYRPKTREIFLFTEVDEHIEEEKLNIPPDMFSQDTIVVMKGDKVKIHFYNLEPIESQEHHTFTIHDPAYKIHADLNADANTIIEFEASQSGIFEYICTYHQPTMRGELVVLSD